MHVDTVPDERVLTVQFENDFFADADRHYTHGTRLAYVPRQADVPDWANYIADRMVDFAQLLPSRPLILRRSEPALRTLVGLALAQEIFTPGNIATRTPDLDERPYAGWLYGAVSVHALYPEIGRLDSIELSVGVVGPASGAREVQSQWHDTFGLQEPQGWDNQLHPEPAVLLLMGTKRRIGQPYEIAGFDVDAHSEFEAGIGNVYDFAGVGFTGRLGRFVADPFGPPRLRPSLSGFEFFTPGVRWGWYLFGGANVRAVAHNIFLDGNTFRDSPSVERKPLVGELQVGGALFVKNVRIAYTHVLRSREYVTQPNPDTFGGLSVSVRF